MWVARRDHPIAGQQSVEREQLPKLQMVLPASKHGMRDNIDQYCREGDIEINCNVFIDSVPAHEGHGGWTPACAASCRN